MNKNEFYVFAMWSIWYRFCKLKLIKNYVIFPLDYHCTSAIGSYDYIIISRLIIDLLIYLKLVLILYKFFYIFYTIFYINFSPRIISANVK